MGKNDLTTHLGVRGLQVLELTAGIFRHMTKLLTSLLKLVWEYHCPERDRFPTLYELCAWRIDKLNVDLTGLHKLGVMPELPKAKRPTAANLSPANGIHIVYRDRDVTDFQEFVDTMEYLIEKDQEDQGTIFGVEYGLEADLSLLSISYYNSHDNKTTDEYDFKPINC